MAHEQQPTQLVAIPVKICRPAEPSHNHDNDSRPGWLLVLAIRSAAIAAAVFLLTTFTLELVTPRLRPPLQSSPATREQPPLAAPLYADGIHPADRHRPHDVERAKAHAAMMLERAAKHRAVIDGRKQPKQPATAKQPAKANIKPGQ